ncbi:MAG: hypothetical protein AAB436_04660, partial [Patescibacteria group bacterium]
GGTYNTNTFTGSALTFGTASTATIQSAASQALNITGNAASTISTSTGNLNLQAGSGTVSLGSSTTLTAGGALGITAGGAITVTSGGTNTDLNLNTNGTGGVNIGTNSSGANTIQIGNSAATAQNIYIGALNSGSSTITIGSSSNGGPINIRTSGVSQSLSASSNVVTALSSSTSTFAVQNTSSRNILAVDTSANQVVLGDASNVTGALKFNGSGGGGTLTLQGPTTPNASNYTLSIPAITANANICTDNAVCTGYQATPASGSFLQQVPTNSAANTVTPTANSVVGLTVNGTSGTAATALQINQAGGAGALSINDSATSGNAATISLTNTSGTIGAGLIINRAGAGGDTTNLLQLLSSAGTTTNGILLTGTYTNLINAGSAFTVTNAGAITAGSTYNTNTFTGSALTFGTAGTATIQSAASQALNITGNAASTISTSAGNLTVQAAGTNSLILDTAGAGSVTVGNANATTISIGTNNAAHTIGIGNTGATGTQAITIGGNGNSANSLILEGGTAANAIQIGNGAAAHGIQIGTDATAAQVLSIGSAHASSTFTVDAGTGTTNLFNSGFAHTIQLATGAAIQSVAIGSTNSSSSLSLQSGTGNLNIGNDTVNKVTTINVGAEATGADLVSIGSTNASSTLTLEGGTAAGAIAIGNGTTAHSIRIGSNSTGDNDILLGGINIGSTVIIEGGTAANAIQIGNGGTAHGIQIGTGTAIQTVAIGSTNSSSTLSLQGGTGSSINIGTGGIANTIQIGNTINSVIQGINIGTNATGSSTNNVTIGSTIAGVTAIQGTTTVTNRTTGSATTLTVNNSTSTGTIFLAQDNGTAVATIADGGAATFKPASGAGQAKSFSVQSAVGSYSIFDVNTDNDYVSLNNGWLTLEGLGAPSNLTVSLLTSGGSLTNARYYWYRVAAYNAAGHISNASVPTTPSSGYTLTANGVSRNSLTWNSVTDAAGYTVYRAVTTVNSQVGADWIESYNAGNVTSFIDTGALTWTNPGSGDYDGNARVNYSTGLYVSKGGKIDFDAATDDTTFINKNALNDNLDIYNWGNTINTVSDTFRTRSTNNNAAAFQIQNAAGQNVFSADTTNQRIAIGPAAVPANGVLTIGTSSTTTGAGGIYFGTDANLYRYAPTVVATDGSLFANGGNLFATTAYTGLSFSSLTNSGIYNTGTNGAGIISIDNGTAGVPVVAIAQGGATLFKNNTNVTNAFQVQNVAGNAVFAIDTTTALPVVNIGLTAAVALTGVVNVGTSTGAAQTVNVGSTHASSTLTLEGGTAPGAIAIGNGTSAHGIQIGSNANGDNDIVIGGTNTGSTLTLEAGTNASAILIGNGATAHGIKIGTGAAIQAVQLGSLSSTSTTLIQGGSGAGAITLSATGSSTTGVLVKNATNSSVAFSVQNAAGSATPFSVDTTNGGLNASNTVVINSGISGTSGLKFSQINSNSAQGSSFSGILGLDSLGNIGLSTASAALTSPALGYWDGLNNPTVTGQSYPQASLAGNATYIDAANGVRLTDAVNTQSGSITWNFSQVPYEHIQYKYKAGTGLAAGTGADGTWFYSFTDGTPTSEFGTGITKGYLIYFSEYHDCVGIAYGGFTDGNQCNTGGGANPLTSVKKYNMDDGQFHDIDIELNYNKITVRWDGGIVINHYQDTSYTRDFTGTNFGFGARTGGSNNGHWIKGLLVTKLGTNVSEYDTAAVSPLANDVYYDQTNDRLGVGTPEPTAKLEVTGTVAFRPTHYSTGTVCQGSTSACTTQAGGAVAGTTIYGTGTTFTSDMVGETIVLSDGTTDTITGYTSATQLTVGTSRLKSGAVTYKINYKGLQVDTTGGVSVGGTFTGNTSTTTTSNSTTTSTITSKNLMYYVQSTDTTGDCNTADKIFNITGLTNAEGSLAYIVSKATDGGCTSNSVDVTTQINGTTIGTVTAANTVNGTVTENYTVAYINAGWRIVGLNSGTAQGANGSDTADYAEWIHYAGNTAPEAGDLLVVDGSGNAVTTTNNPYDRHIIGVVSTNPFQVGGIDDGHSVIMALTGRVPLKVSLENGPILPGDPLTSSSTAGVAMKATGSGKIIGSALEAYDGTQSSSQIMTQLQIGFDDPTAGSGILQGNQNVTGDLTVDGNTSVQGSLAANGISVTGNSTMAALLVSGSLDVSGDLTVTGSATIGTLTVQTATVNGDLNVVGSTATGSLNVSGNATVGSLNINGAAMASSLIVNNLTSFGGDIRLTGAVNTRQATLKTFKANKAITAGSVVILDDTDGHEGEITTTTNVNDTRVIGVAVTGGAIGDDIDVAISGWVQVRVDTTLPPLTAGKLLSTGANEGTVQSPGSAAAGSIIGKTTAKQDANNLVWILVSLQ